jgi:hypothetical protein
MITASNEERLAALPEAEGLKIISALTHRQMVESECGRSPLPANHRTHARGPSHPRPAGPQAGFRAVAIRRKWKTALEPLRLKGNSKIRRGNMRLKVRKQEICKMKGGDWEEEGVSGLPCFGKMGKTSKGRRSKGPTGGDRQALVGAQLQKPKHFIPPDFFRL